MTKFFDGGNNEKVPIVSCLHFYGTKSRIELSIFALEQKFKVHCNGLQKTFLLSYHTTKSEQVENSLVLPKYYEHKN